MTMIMMNMALLYSYLQFQEYFLLKRQSHDKTRFHYLAKKLNFESPVVKGRLYDETFT